MQSEELVECYPRLFHIAWEGSWPNIRRHGLLSTRALMDLYEVESAAKRRILGQHRSHWVEIRREGLARAVVRDQKPMSDEGVRRALGANVHLADWYYLLNSMVFFWPTKKRLLTMMSARAYWGMRHDVLVVDTEKLLVGREGDIRISPMNSGATKPFPHPRSMEMFKGISDYPFEQRLRRYREEGAIAEVCVVDGVKNIEACVLEVRTVTVKQAAEWI